MPGGLHAFGPFLFETRRVEIPYGDFAAKEPAAVIRTVIAGLSGGGADGALPDPQAAGGEFPSRSDARNSVRRFSISSRSTPVSVLRTRIRGSFHRE